LNEASEAELLNDLVAAGSDIIGAKAFIKAQGRKRSPSINPFGTARGGGSPAAAAAGSGVTSAGSRWKRAQQRVSVLSAALGKRRQQMLNHNKTAGGEDSKSHDGKNIPSGSCAEGNSPDTIQGRGRSVARTTCLLDTLIALMTSPCLVQPLDRARALLWCHSILDMLIPKKKTAAATSINAESGAGNEIGQEETEERSSRAPGQCRLLIVHAAAAALTDLPALLVRRFCAKLVSKTDVQTAGSEEESLRDATRRSEIATSSDQVDDDEMLRIEIREEAAFAVAEALHRLEKRSGLASADEAKKASNVFHPNDSSSSNSTSSKGKFCSSGWHRPEKVEWWEDLGLCLRSLQTACHLLVETSIRDPSSNDNNKSSSKGSNSGHDSCLGGANPDEGNGVNGNNWPNELVMRRYVQMLLGDRDLTPASVSHTTIDALFDASARLAGRAPPMVGITSFSRKDRPSSVADLQGSVPAGSDGKGVGVKKAQQKAQVAAVSPPHVAEAPPTFQKASANLAYVLSTVAMVRLSISLKYYMRASTLVQGIDEVARFMRPSMFALCISLFFFSFPSLIWSSSSRWWSCVETRNGRRGWRQRERKQWSKRSEEEHNCVSRALTGSHQNGKLILGKLQALRVEKRRKALVMAEVTVVTVVAVAATIAA
jgi:hypothetical protein